MSSRSIQAVFFWRLNRTAYHATYGRIKGSTKYTKDYLQSSGDQQVAIDRVFGRLSQETIDLEYRWSTGAQKGYWRIATDGRGNLAWDYDSAPPPWRLGDPKADPAIAISGNGNVKTETAAEAEWKRLQEIAVNPWLVAVKFRDEDRILHVSGVLEKPPAGLEQHGLENWPPEIRKAIEASGSHSGFIEFEEKDSPRMMAIEVRAEEGAQEAVGADGVYTSEGVDTRQLVDRQIRERRGQQQFRDGLRRRYGSRCLVTGCEILAILEAAHILPYRGVADNHVENGLLLRADIHTLFDLNLVGIEPRQFLIKLHPQLAKEYGQLDGKTLMCAGGKSPSQDALQKRYKDFLERMRFPA